MPPPGISAELFHRLDTIADAVNPVLILWAVLVLLRHAREWRARGQGLPLARTLGVWLLAIVAVYVVAHINRWAHIWPGPHPIPYRFPSGHESLAACLATLGATLERRSLWLTVPLLGLYSTLIVLLGYHHPLDILGALVLAPPLTLLVLRALRAPGAVAPAPIESSS